ncbi:hypothetical protein ONZ45_g19485 [Pleurotus djamor]|nr:hypothetical protein ONZ45_g19485 [Pleurotus djamor]
MYGRLAYLRSPAVYKLPPEVLLDTFLLLYDEVYHDDHLHLCRTCKRWVPIAQTALYRSVSLTFRSTYIFARTIEGHRSLAPLVRHLSLNRKNLRVDWMELNKILAMLSPHKALLSFHIPAIPYINHQSAEIKDTISLLSFLSHLDVDINLFDSFRAMKQFIVSFPNLRTLDVFGDYFAEEWLRRSASEVLIPFPPTIRNLRCYLETHRTLEAFLQWIPCHPQGIQSFSVTIRTEDGHSSLSSTLRSFGTELTSLKLVYHLPSRAYNLINSECLA